MRFRLLSLVLSAVVAAACGGKPLQLVAQTGQGLSGAIVQAQQAAKALTVGGVITAQQALVVQRGLGAAADTMVPLPDLLIAIDNASKAGQTDAARIASALDILRAVGVKLDDVVAGLPVGETASNVLAAVTEARKLQRQIVDALARRKTAEALELFRRGGPPAHASWPQNPECIERHCLALAN